MTTETNIFFETGRCPRIEPWGSPHAMQVQLDL